MAPAGGIRDPLGTCSSLFIDLCNCSLPVFTINGITVNGINSYCYENLMEISYKM